jgi:hypothetical protein
MKSSSLAGQVRDPAGKKAGGKKSAGSTLQQLACALGTHTLGGDLILIQFEQHKYR